MIATDIDIDFDESSIPNGVLIKHWSGTTAFISIDDKGQMVGDVCEIKITASKKGDESVLLDDMLIFVHAISGSDSLLTKRLFSLRLDIKAKERTVWFLLRSNNLQSVLTDIWNKFMDGRLLLTRSIDVQPKKGVQ